jgi:hypothetical protein
VRAIKNKQRRLEEDCVAKDGQNKINMAKSKGRFMKGNGHDVIRNLQSRIQATAEEVEGSKLFTRAI